MYTYETAIEAMNDLIKRGYNADFNLEEKKVRIVVERATLKETVSLSPNDFEIDEFYRFEGESDPEDETVVYAISSKKHHVKGILINAFGPYSNSTASEVIKMLSAHPSFKNLSSFKRSA